MTRYLVPDPLTSGYETLLSSTVQLYFIVSYFDIVFIDLNENSAEL